jgi:hypothetical protein
MATVNEAEQARTALGAALKAGLDTLDLNQAITFHLYQRKVLPLDGYVFWLRDATAAPLVVMGAIHYISDLRQLEDTSLVSNRVIFSAENLVNDFATINPSTMWIADFDKVRFAFSSRASYFQQSNLYHYVGIDLDPSMANMIIDDPAQLPADTDLIVSNSLPIWLSLSNYNPAWHVDIPMPPITLFPSFLVPQNEPPVFGAVQIDPEQTTAYQMAPWLSAHLDHYQLAHDRVTVTLYGCTNRMALDFVDAVNQYTLDTDNMGIVGVPAIMRDDKKTQTEMMIIATKKHITFEVSYQQSTVRNLARQMIEHAKLTLYAQDHIIGNPPIPIP